MKIVHTSLVFASGPPVPGIVISNPFSLSITSDVVQREILKPVAAQLSAFGPWYPTKDSIQSPFLSFSKYDNGFSVLADIQKAQISFDSLLSFDSVNPVPILAKEMGNVLSRNRLPIHSVGMNIHGLCEVSSARERLKALIAPAAPFSIGADFNYAAIVAHYNFGLTPQTKVTLQVILDYEGGDVSFKANFNHTVDRQPIYLEAQMFIDASTKYISDLQSIVSTI